MWHQRVPCDRYARLSAAMLTMHEVALAGQHMARGQDRRASEVLKIRDAAHISMRFIAAIAAIAAAATVRFVTRAHTLLWRC